jgi:hypothetical protein
MPIVYEVQEAKEGDVMSLLFRALVLVGAAAGRYQEIKKKTVEDEIKKKMVEDEERDFVTRLPEHLRLPPDVAQRKVGSGLAVTHGKER